MKGWCYVIYGLMLIIEVGIVIKGDKEICVVLIVELGGKLIVRGMVDVFIVFIFEMFVGKWKLGDWGGLILCGYVWNNEDIMQIEGGLCIMYGGLNNVDNLGVLSYVCVEFVGYLFKKNQEINGIIFGLVGNGM